MELDGHRLQVSCGEAVSCKLVGMSADNWPTGVNDVAFTETCGFSSDALRKMIHETVMAISLEESRYTLNGALLCVNKEKAYMVATDGHRLAYSEPYSPPEYCFESVRILIPRKVMCQLSALLPKKEVSVKVEMEMEEGHLKFSFGDVSIVSRKLTGQFPNWEAVMPRNASKSATFQRDHMLGALKRLLPVADQRSHAIKIDMNGHLELSAHSPEHGDAKETIFAAQREGGDVTIGFNAQYLVDALSAMSAGEVKLALKDDQSCGELTSQDPNFRYVVMPMRI